MRLSLVLGVMLLASSPCLARDVSVGVLSRLAPRSLEIVVDAPGGVRVDGERRDLGRGERLTVSARGQDLVVDGRPARSCAVDASALRVRVRGEGWRSYAGTLSLRARDARIEAVLRIPLEDYVAGVVASEMPDASPSALQAQAIAARSFALAILDRSPHQGDQLCDLTHCQSFRGVPAAGSRAREAARATRGRVLQSANDVLEAYYHSTCGGHTASPVDVFGVARPGLRGVPDLRPDGRAWCAASPHFRWTYAIPGKSLRRALASDPETSPGATLTAILVLDRTPQGRVIRVEIRGAQVKRPSGETFWQVLGRALGWGTVESTWFQLDRRGATYTFRGRGLGHGVGMCQYGAMEMARTGRNTRDILAHYYPEARVGYAR